MYSWRTGSPVIVGISLFLCTSLEGAMFNVVGRDGTHATIVIPDKRDDPRFGVVEEYAAQELQYHIGESTGVTLPIVKESEKPKGTGLIYLGACRQTEESGITTGHLAPNAGIIRLIDGDLYMVGNDRGRVFASDRNKGPWQTYLPDTRIGTLFAVYEFLEEQLGVKWLWPGKSGEVIPGHTEIRVQDLDTTWTPRFVQTYLGDNPYRVNIFEPGRWSSPEALEAYLYKQAVWLRRQRFAIGTNMVLHHSFKSHWNRFGKTHPEFFNMLADGTRRSDPTIYGGTPDHVSMCVSQPGLWKQIVKDWTATRSAWNPCIKLGENDNPGKCACPECMAWDVPDPGSKVPSDERLARAKEAFAKGDPGWVGHLGSLSDRYARFYLAVQKEAEKIDPEVTVLGFAYENYVSAPIRARLNRRVVISFVPAFIYPWTDEKRDQMRERWDRWYEAGASMVLRPNWGQAGHNMPVFFARKLGEDFSYFAGHGLAATAYDSLTGQWSTQGPNLYVLARVHTEPERPVDDILDEYYSGFGPAKKAVSDYFRHWEEVSDAVTDESFSEACARTGGNEWKGFVLLADRIFTPEVMREGRRLLTEAQGAAKGDPTAEGRVAFLERGLRKAEMTLATQVAFRAYKKGADVKVFSRALNELDTYRRSVDTKDTDNVSFGYWYEGIYGWDRSVIALVDQHESDAKLPSPWKFMWDPEDKGESKGWHERTCDDTRWFDIRVESAYGEQEVGRKWEAEHGTPHLGLSWYRTTFTLKPSAAPQQVRLVFVAVDEACTVWVNGTRVLERPYPCGGDTDSWKKSFEVEITDAVTHDRPNTVAVRVENNAGAGGIWKPVWLRQTDAPDSRR